MSTVVIHSYNRSLLLLLCWQQDVDVVVDVDAVAVAAWWWRHSDTKAEAALSRQAKGSTNCCRQAYLARHTKSSVVVVVGYEEDSCCCWHEAVVGVLPSRQQLNGSSCQGKALVPDNLGAQMNNEADEEDRPSRLVVQQQENVQLN